MSNKSHFFRQSSGGGGDAFIATFRTTTANESIILQYPSNGTYSGTIDWGDGTVVANSFANSTHIYTVAGDYDVTILGEFDYGFNGSNASRRKIIDVKQWGNGITILKQAFYDARSLNITAADILDLGITTDISELFYQNLSNIFNISINNWDVSNVTNILRLFLGAPLFNQPLNNWDTSNVTTMDRTFANATSFNQDISNWNFSGLNNVNSLFFFMFGKSSTNYNSTYYDNLLIKWASDPSLGGLQPNIINTIDMGSIKYTTNGASARASILANNKAQVINDGGIDEYLLNFEQDGNLGDYILLNQPLVFNDVFRFEFRFIIKTEFSGYAPVFGHSQGTSSVNRILVSKTNAKTIINIGGSSSGNSLIYNYPFQFETEYVFILERDINDDVYLTINDEPTVLIGNNSNSWAGANPTGETKIGATGQRYLTGQIFYADLGQGNLFLLNEGSGNIVTAENNIQGEIKTTKDINYINNVMWEDI